MHVVFASAWLVFCLNCVCFGGALYPLLLFGFLLSLPKVSAQGNFIFIDDRYGGRGVSLLGRLQNDLGVFRPMASWDASQRGKKFHSFNFSYCYIGKRVNQERSARTY